jgi:hypothetical protein
LVTDRVQMSLPNVTASAASVAASGAPPGRPAVAMLAIVVAVTAWRLLALIWTGHDLQPDEAQYWLWAQEPAFGYFSKPPMVAWLIGATTAACGDGEACVRLGSPLLHGMAALAIWRLGQEIGGPRLGLWSGTLYLTLPGIGFSSLLVSTDVPLLLCWCVALLALWRLSHGGGVGWAVAGGGVVEHGGHADRHIAHVRQLLVGDDVTAAAAGQHEGVVHHLPGRLDRVGTVVPPALRRCAVEEKPPARLSLGRGERVLGRRGLGPRTPRPEAGDTGDREHLQDDEGTGHARSTAAVPPD